jgi:hypothetical protein
MFGEPANTLTQVYKPRKKSGSSSGPFGPLPFGRRYRFLPAINQAIAPIGLTKMLIKIHPHFGRCLICVSSVREPMQLVVRIEEL